MTRKFFLTKIRDENSIRFHLSAKPKDGKLSPCVSFGTRTYDGQERYDLTPQLTQEAMQRVNEFLSQIWDEEGVESRTTVSAQILSNRERRIDLDFCPVGPDNQQSIKRTWVRQYLPVLDEEIVWFYDIIAMRTS